MSQNLKLEIRIDANGNAQAYIAGTNERLGKLSDKTKETASAFDTLNNSMARIAQWSIALEAIGVAVTGIPQKLIEEASAMEQLNTRLKSGAETTADYIANKQYLLETSNRLSVDLATLTDGFSKMQIVQASGVLTTQESKQILEGLTNALSASGGTAENMKQVMYGLGQALSSGTVHMEELNQVTEPITGLLDNIAKSAGVTTGQFRKMVEEGKITSSLLADTMIPALSRYADVSQERYDSIAGAQTRLANSWKEAGDLLSQPINDAVTPILDGFGSALVASAQAVKDFYDSFEEMQNAIMVSAGAAGLLMVAANIGAITTATRAAVTVTYAYIAVNAMLARSAGATAVALTGLNAALNLIAKNPIGIALTAIAAGYAYLSLTADDATISTDTLSESQKEAKTQAQLLLDQEKAFGSTLADVNSTLSIHGQTTDAVKEKYQQILKPLDEFDRALKLIEKDFAKLDDEQADKLANPTKKGFEEALKAHKEANEKSKRLYSEQVEAAKKAAEEIIKAKKRAQDEEFDYFEKNLQAQEKAQQEYQQSVADTFNSVRRELDPTIDLYEAYNKKVQAVTASTLAGSTDQETMLKKLKENLDKQLTDLQDKNTTTADAVRVTWEQSVKRLDDAFADVWVDIFNGAEDFGGSLKRWFTQLLAELAHQAITKPIVVSMTSAMGISVTGTASATSGSILSSLGSTPSSIYSMASMSGALSQGASYGLSALGSGSLVSAGSTMSSMISTGNYAGAMGTAMGAYLPVIGGAIAGYAKAGVAGAIAGGGGAYLGAQLGTMIMPGIGTAIGAALGAIGGTALVTGITGGSWETKDQIAKLTVSVDKASAAFGTVQSKDGGWFNSSKQRTLWSSDKSVSTGMTDAVTALSLSIKDNAKKLGYDFNDSFKASFSASIKGKSAQQIQDIFTSWLDKAGTKMIEQSKSLNGTLADALKPMQLSGESASTTLARLLTEFDAFNNPIGRLNNSLSTLNMSTVKAVDGLVKMAGSMQNLAQMQSSYIDNFYSSTEKFSILKETISRDLANVGISALPKSVSEYKSLVSSQDLNTVDGQKAYITLISHAQDFKSYFDQGGGSAGLSNVVMGKFSAGGYTGDGGVLEPAGIVHKGEFVVPNWMVKREPQLISKLENVRKNGYSNGGMVGGSININSANNSNVDDNNTKKEIERLYEMMKRMVDIIRKWDGDGMPTVRV